MKKIESFPLLITLILGMTGWLVNHLVDRITIKPLLEYSFVEKSINDSIKKYTYRFENVTNNQKFDSLDLILISKKDNLEKNLIGDSITDFKYSSVKLISNAYLSHVINSDHVQFTIVKMQPKMVAQASFKLKKGSVPVLTYRSQETLSVRESNLETYFLKNETIIMLCLLGVYLSIMLIYIIKNFKDL